ncbi:hypothetical protein PENTCL1PPCAC_15243, partial [Pristionchus entomophagus]
SLPHSECNHSFRCFLQYCLSILLEESLGSEFLWILEYGIILENGKDLRESEGVLRDEFIPDHRVLRASMEEHERDHIGHSLE